MSNVSRIAPALTAYAERQIALIRRTVAKDCNNDEFDLFVHTAHHLGLDPLRKQVYAFVYSKDDPKRRKMTIVTGIDGFRTIADRTSNYRPDEDEPTYEIDPELKGPSNPIGLVKATVRVYKFSHGDWHKVTASAHWDEYAPMKEECPEGFDWVETGETWNDSGKPKKKKVARGEVIQVLDTSGNWGKMPRLMLAKVAEALALRKAWPDSFANVYAQEEVDRTRILDDMTPSEAAEAGNTAARLEKVGLANTLMLSFDPKHDLEAVPIGKAADRIFAFIDENRDEPSAIALWQSRNRTALREFWSRARTDALEVKKALEKATHAIGADA